MHIFIDPAKDVIPPLEARNHPDKYNCNCVVSRAIKRAIDETKGRRFRRWLSWKVRTMYTNTFITVTDRDMNTRTYRAAMPENIVDEREVYDNGKRKVQAASGVLEFELRAE
jgi:hypothetical protein